MGEESVAEAVTDCIEALLLAARTMNRPEGYAAVESVLAILTQSRRMARLAAGLEDPDLLDDVIEVMQGRCGFSSPRTRVEAWPVQWDESSPVSVATDVVEELVRSAHTFDLLHGRDSSIRAILRAVNHLKTQGVEENDFNLAWAAADAFEERGGMVRLFQPPSSEGQRAESSGGERGR